MRRGFLLTTVLAALAAVAGAGGVDLYGFRQSAGVFLTVDGKSLSVFLDFEARRYEGEEPASVAVNLETDLDLWVQGDRLASGKHRWTFLAEGERWTLGEEGPKDPKRFLLSVRDAGEEAVYLSASLSPDASKESLLLRIRFGPREGLLRLGLLEAAAEAVPAAPVSVVELRALRDRLRDVASRFATARRNRHGWSDFLLELGGALHDGPGEGFVREITFERAEDRVSLCVRGLMPGGRAGVEALRKKLARGELSRLFERVSRPLARLLDRETGWSYEITAEASREWWERREPVPALSRGEDPREVAEEILLLEARLTKETRGALSTISECQTHLLRAKRDAGVIVSRILPGAKVEEEGGISRFPVTITISGAGCSIIRFLRAIEDWDTPLVMLPVRLDHDDYGPRAEIRVVFLDYTPLEERRPAVFASVKARGLSPDFEKNREVYLRGVGLREAYPFLPPEWTRDPFAPPREEE